VCSYAGPPHGARGESETQNKFEVKPKEASRQMSIKPPVLDSLQLVAKDLQLHSNVTRLRENNTIVWARMAGFAPWPARYLHYFYFLYY